MVTVAMTVFRLCAHDFVYDSSRHPGVPAEKLRLEKRARENPDDMEAWIKLSLWCAENSYAEDAVGSWKEGHRSFRCGNTGPPCRTDMVPDRPMLRHGIMTVPEYT